MIEGTQKPGEAEQTYNPMYERFVDDAQDHQKILGIVGYGLYKSAKREWACQFRERHGRGPNAAELDAYVTSWTPDNIKGQEARAAQILAEYANSIEEQAKPRILKEALQGKFWDDVLHSIAANAIYTVILVLIAVVLKYSGVDFLSVFDAIKESEPSANTPSNSG